MNFVAVICELNPLHYGHCYLFEEVKRRYPQYKLLALMSGNYVQRGEAAIAEKHLRARCAIEAGADICIELPLPFAVSSAEMFAYGGLKLLNCLENVQLLAFGCESPSIAPLQRAAELLESKDEALENAIKDYARTLPYPKAMQLALTEAMCRCGDEAVDTTPLFLPNNALAIAYLRAIIRLNSKIKPIAIERRGDGYNDVTVNTEYPSATAIRALWKEGADIGETVPPYVAETLMPLAARAEKAAALIRYAALTKDVSGIADVDAGLCAAIKRADAPTTDLMLEQIKSKRYTAARIRRALLYTILDFTKQRARKLYNAPLYVNVLALPKASRKLLSELGATIPIVTKAKESSALPEEYADAVNYYRFCDEVFSTLTALPPVPQVIY